MVEAWRCSGPGTVTGIQRMSLLPPAQPLGGPEAGHKGSTRPYAGTGTLVRGAWGACVDSTAALPPTQHRNDNVENCTLSAFG